MLKISELTASYGSAQILNGVDFQLGNREIVSLLGRNGVGKTTLLKTIMGIVSPTRGSVLVEAVDVTRWPTFQIAKMGVAYVPQGRGIFGKLTVEENLKMGLRASSDTKAEIPDFIFNEFPVLDERRTQIADTLSGGQKQQLAISRALCSNPKILLLDEPSEGIQPNIVHDIGVFLRRLVKERDISVLVVEQNLELVHLASDRFEIMVKGEVVHKGAMKELSDEQLLKKYLSV